MYKMRNRRVFFIDLNKISGQKFELFPAMASVFEIGFPIDYLLFRSDTSLAFKFREKCSELFLKSFKDKVPGLRPAFFFTDKETSYSDAIHDV